MKPCAALKDQQMSHKMSSLIRLLELSIRDWEVGYSQLFSDKTTRLMLEVDVSHWRWHSSVLLCVVVCHMCLSCVVAEIFNIEQRCHIGVSLKSELMVNGHSRSLKVVPFDRYIRLASSLSL